MEMELQADHPTFRFYSLLAVQPQAKPRAPLSFSSLLGNTH